MTLKSCQTWYRNQYPGTGIILFTARVRSTYDGRLCFHRCVSVQLLGGGGYPIPGLRGYPIPGLDGGRYPSQVWMVGGTPSQVWMVGGYPGQVWMVGEYHIPGLDGLGVPRTGWHTPNHHDWMGYPPPHNWMGYTPHDWMGYPPSPHQHSEQLLRGGRYASRVHAGGLSCSKCEYLYLTNNSTLSYPDIACTFCKISVLYRQLFKVC